MNILNLYGGIGGNRKLWGDNHKIVCIENNPDIANVYHDLFPKDKVVVADAHQYLLENYQEYDFIWSSPPCPTHSDIRRCGVDAGQYEAQYPAMELYQEIILLKHFAKCKWVIENVKPYYEPLIHGHLIERHLFWSNFHISDFKTADDRRHDKITGGKEIYGFDLNKYTVDNKRAILRNMVNPELGLHILNESTKEQQVLL